MTRNKTVLLSSSDRPEKGQGARNGTTNKQRSGRVPSQLRDISRSTPPSPILVGSGTGSNRLSLAYHALVTQPIPIGPASVTINRDDRFIVCAPNGTISAGAEEGFFARDTRFVSGYRLWINERQPVLLNSSPVQFFSSRFESTNPALIDDGGEITRHSLSIRLDRTVSGGVHEDYDIVNYGRRTVRLTIEIEIDSDFADIFDVKLGQLVRRGVLNSQWLRSRRELRTTYVNREFWRQLVVQVEKADAAPQFANGRLVFVASIPPKGAWHTCLKWLALTSRGRRPTTLDCHAIANSLPAVGSARLPKVRIETSLDGTNLVWI